MWNNCWWEYKIRRYLSSRKESMSPHKYLYTNFHSSFLHNRQNTRNNPNDHQLMNKQSLIYPDHGILSSIKRNYQCSKTMWMNLKTIMLSERCQTQKITCCKIPFTRNSGKDKKKSHSDRKQVSVCQGLAGERTDCKGKQGNISGWQKFPYHDLLYIMTVVVVVVVVVVVTQPYTALKTTVFLFEAMCEN